jgi:hypothetical protein
MCDYSLMMIPNRLAIEGEDLIAHRFKAGSTGMVSCCDFDKSTTRLKKGWWQRLRDTFSSESEPSPVVCVPPGARLQLNGLAEPLKAHFHVGSCEEVVFTQISGETSQHRDALYFSNGATILLQLLPEGQRLKVLKLSSSEDITPDQDRSHLVVTV